MRYEFTADPNTYATKPDKQQAAQINNNLQPADVSSIDDFIEGIQQGIS